MDHVELRLSFVLRASLMKCVPACMKTSYRKVMRLIFREADRALADANVLRCRVPQGDLTAKSSLTVGSRR